VGLHLPADVNSIADYDVMLHLYSGRKAFRLVLPFTPDYTGDGRDMTRAVRSLPDFARAPIRPRSMSRPPRISSRTCGGGPVLLQRPFWRNQSSGRRAYAFPDSIIQTQRHKRLRIHPPTVVVRLPVPGHDCHDCKEWSPSGRLQE
jgi:hypothetical protein